MTKHKLTPILIIWPLLIIVSCGGGNGRNIDGLTVYDVWLQITNVEGATSDCPETAYLKLTLKVNENDISGFAELFGFGMIGNAQPVNGQLADDVFSIDPFGLGVIIEAPPDAFFPGSSFSFDFAEFRGVIVGADENGLISGMEGTVSGEIFKNTGDVVVCNGEFMGEFTGEAKSPEGCLSRTELGLEENRACPAEAISRMCDNASQLCPIPVPSPAPIPTPPPGDFRIDNTCEASGCFTLTNCSFAPMLTNLVIDPNGGVSGNISSPEGEHFACF